MKNESIFLGVPSLIHNSEGGQSHYELTAAMAYGDEIAIDIFVEAEKVDQAMHQLAQRLREAEPVYPELRRMLAIAIFADIDCNKNLRWHCQVSESVFPESADVLAERISITTIEFYSESDNYRMAFMGSIKIESDRLPFQFELSDDFNVVLVSLGD